MSANSIQGSGIGFLNILEARRLRQQFETRLLADECISSSKVKCKKTPIPLRREEIIQQFETTMEEEDAAEGTLKCKSNVLDISESQERNFVKRRLIEYWSEEDEEEDSESSVMYGSDKVYIKIKYGDRVTLSYVPMLSNVADIMKKIIMDKYKLSPGSYRLDWLNEDWWIMLESNRDWESFIRIYEKMGPETIRVSLLAS